MFWVSNYYDEPVITFNVMEEVFKTFIEAFQSDLKETSNSVFLIVEMFPYISVDEWKKTLQ